MSHRQPAPIVLVALLAGAACSRGAVEEGAVFRGDQAWADGDVEEALAEYRLALLQGSEEAQVYARIGHAYAELGRVDEAADYYGQAAERDSVFADQAVADLVGAARDAESRGDGFGVAAAFAAASGFRPGVSVAELALPLARYYAQNGENARALPFFQKALAGPEVDSASPVLFETGLAYEQVGDCERALALYEQFQEGAPPAQRSEVSWRIGECSFLVALRIRREEEGEEAEEEALSYLQATIDLGEPRNRLAQAYFEKGEILAGRGECEAAVEAFRHVRIVDPSGTGPVVIRAQERIDEIRFGRRRPPEPGGARESGCM